MTFSRYTQDNEGARPKGLARARPLLHLFFKDGSRASSRMAKSFYWIHWSEFPVPLQRSCLLTRFTCCQVITFGSSDLADVVRQVPQERFLLETDGPYMTPTPFR